MTQSTYAVDKVDEAVCNAIMDIFGRITDAPDEMVLQKKYKKEIASCKARETKLNMELRKYTTQLDKLNDEIADSLTGDSVYSPEQLSAAITGINQKITEAKEQLEMLQNEMSSKKASMEKLKPAYERFTGWADEFVAATTERKKMIISQVVNRIEISKGYKINLVLSPEYERFCEGWDVIRIDTNV